MSHVALAKTKERRKSGGDVNYYLEVIPASQTFPETVVEVDDINEALGLTFWEGTVFKSTWRLCKLRQALGKPGSTNIYEAEKIVYYSKRTYAVAQRREQGLSRFGLFRRWLSGKFSHNWTDIDPLGIVVHVPDPKRLDPYFFCVGNLLEALGATEYEKVVISEVLRIALMRKIHHLPPVDEPDNAQRLLTHAELILKVEQIQSTPKPPSNRKG